MLVTVAKSLMCNTWINITHDQRLPRFFLPLPLPPVLWLQSPHIASEAPLLCFPRSGWSSCTGKGCAGGVWPHVGGLRMLIMQTDSNINCPTVTFVFVVERSWSNVWAVPSVQFITDWPCLSLKHSQSKVRLCVCSLSLPYFCFDRW